MLIVLLLFFCKLVVISFDSITPFSNSASRYNNLQTGKFIRNFAYCVHFMSEEINYNVVSDN